MDFERIKSSAEGYKTAMTKFLRDLIAIPGESGCGMDLHQHLIVLRYRFFDLL
jgi:hypothetical protein